MIAVPASADQRQMVVELRAVAGPEADRARFCAGGSNRGSLRQSSRHLCVPSRSKVTVKRRFERERAQEIDCRRADSKLQESSGWQDLSEAEWLIVEPLLPAVGKGKRRVDDHRLINGIFFELRTGSPRRKLPTPYGPYTTIYNRFNRWPRRASGSRRSKRSALRRMTSVYVDPDKCRLVMNFIV